MLLSPISLEEPFRVPKILQPTLE